MIIDYTAVPTFSRIHYDENPYIFVMGPVGCLVQDTEFLTDIGWKKISEYKDGDKIAQWYPDGRVEFVYPDRYIKAPYSGVFHRFHNKYTVDMALTEEHRIPYFDWRGNLKVTTPPYIQEKLLTRAEGPKYYIPNTFNVSGKEGLSLTDAQLRVMVMVHADGSIYGSRCVAEFHKTIKIDRCERLLKEAKIQYVKRPRKNRENSVIFRFEPPMISKHYELHWYKAAQNQLKIIFDEIKYWDGIGHSGGDLRFSSSYKIDADFIQYVSHACGHRATISIEQYPNNPNWEDTYIVHITKNAEEKISFRNCKYSTIENHDGYKYCFSVPSTFFVARYNGKVFVTGNSGKSSGCVMHLFLAALNQAPQADGVRRSRWAVIRSTYPKLKSTVIKTWKDWFKSELVMTYGTPITGKIQMLLEDQTKLDMEIMFLALDKEDDVEKLQSLELTGAHINEAREVSKGVLDMLRTRILRYPSPKDGGCTRSFVLLDYNAVPINHWLYKIAEETRPEKHSFYRQPPAMLKLENGAYIVNPDADNLDNLHKDYYPNQILGADEDFINVYILNNYGNLRYGRPVYREYDDRIHSSNSPLVIMQGLPLVIGMDCGLTPAAVFTQLSPVGQFTVYDEIVTEDVSIQSFVYDYLWPLLRNKYPRFRHEIIVDPAANTRSQNDKKSAMDIVKKSGLNVRCARSNDDVFRREAVTYFLRRRGGFILDGTLAPVLRRGFISEYKFPKLNSSGLDEKYQTSVDKRSIYTHVHDACQYAATEFYQRDVGSRQPKRRYQQKYTSPADRGSGY